jgi:hypothetical protein
LSPAHAEAEDVLGIAARVAAAIEGVEGRYFIGGSLASSLQGEPRATNDIDLVIDLPLGRVGAFVEALGQDFEADAPELRRSLLRGSCHNIFYLPQVTKIDLFGLGSTAFDQSEFSRRYQVNVPGYVSLWFKSPEDTILRKLLWYREGGEVSSKQWRDVVQVLRISHPQLDTSYLDGWASRLALSTLLTRARSESQAG